LPELPLVQGRPVEMELATVVLLITAQLRIRYVQLIKRSVHLERAGCSCCLWRLLLLGQVVVLEYLLYVKGEGQLVDEEVPRDDGNENRLIIRIRSL